MSPHQESEPADRLLLPLRSPEAAAVLGKFRFEIHPELFNSPGVRLGANGPELRIGPLGVELFDVVPLAGVSPPGEELEVLSLIHISSPRD